ncbi:hypothetical protein GCM10011609_33060 [Lentzea pudingi]|uniref:Serine phosphatase RsbU, regulator of sigma subunit n=1 Tax=Lentzea pudingi TaxID=1789439 RepID=A0ABQ2HWS1_9PSEU|nr:SpoIIE family protein phosphatase [Lentzea pudingi]GGM92975.1 hypothetical protein GCM10011609_33060 [Lentzea pudingi]
MGPESRRDDATHLRRVGDPHVVRDRFDESSPALAAWEGPEQRLVAANEAFRRFAGVSEPVGLAARELLPGLEGRRVQAGIDRVYVTGEPHTVGEWGVQVDRAAGRPVEAFVDLVMEPYFHDDGAVRGVSAYAVDVTEQVRDRRGRGVAELQAALLPTSLPVLPQARIAARYLAGEHGPTAGGDWFDAIPLKDGAVVLAVGDVAGSGVTASAAMGQLRTVLAFLLHTNDDLLSALEQTNSFAAGHRALHAATLAVVKLDPRTGELSYSSCGHPPPLVVRADGTTEFLSGPTSGPLGVGRSPALSTARLAPDDLVLLYSDGLVERPGRTPGEAAVELATLAADAAMNRVLPHTETDQAVERVCRLTIDLLTRTGYRDDVTTLAVQRLAEPVPPLSVRFASTLSNLALARREIRDWLAGVNAGRRDREVLEFAVGEATTNTAEHAYPPGRQGTVLITAQLTPDGICELRVGDEGRWRAADPGSTDRGRGLMLCQQLVDEVTVTHPPQRAGEPPGARGTTVTFRHRIRQPPMLASGTSPDASHEEPSPAFRVETVEGPDTAVVRVHGPVDAMTSTEFARHLFLASRGGVLPLTVDLSEVSHLLSAGVRILYDLAGQLAAHHHEPVLIAHRGSPAAFVLDLVDLPWSPA